MMDKNYGGVIWTNHVLERLKDRNIKQGDAWATWRNPDKSKFSRIKGAWVYEKNIGRRSIEIIAKKNEKGEWIIISVWSKFGSMKKQNIVLSIFKKIFSFNNR